jgi:hypothetical protein
MFDIFRHPLHRPLSSKEKKSYAALGIVPESQLALTQGSASTKKSQLRQTHMIAMDHIQRFPHPDKNYDVAFDRPSWPGTMRYRTIILQLYDDYVTTVRGNSKWTKLCLELVGRVTNCVHPGKILSRPNQLTEVRSVLDEKELQPKIMQSFYHLYGK